MSKPQLSLQPLAAGSLPHTNPDVACRLALDTLGIPTWPQLPRRSFLESMYVQYSERFPDVVVTDERIFPDRDRDLEHAAISPDYAAGLHRFLELDLGRAPGEPGVVKGQVTGPASWGLTGCTKMIFWHRR